MIDRFNPAFVARSVIVASFVLIYQVFALSSGSASAFAQASHAKRQPKSAEGASKAAPEAAAPKASAPAAGSEAEHHVSQIAKPTDEGSARLSHYLQFAHPIGSATLDFPGPYGGYTLAHFRIKDMGTDGDTIVRDHTFLIDFNLSHDGTFLAPDTLTSFTDMVPFEIQFANGHTIHARLAPTHKREEIRSLDTNFRGSIGYGLLRQFVTAFDFKKNTLTFYPLYANVSISETDPNSIQLPLLDDAYLTYCHCPYPTIWLDATAPPLKRGRVQLAPQQPISQVFTTSLDPKTQRTLEKETTTDPATGKKSKVGLSLADFRVGMGALAANGGLSSSNALTPSENLAGRSPRRAVEDLPQEFHDLSVSVMGTLGSDVLRTFSGLIIDPSRNKIILVK